MLSSENPIKHYLGQQLLPPVPDHLEMAGCTSESTPANSGSSSAFNSSSPDPSKVWTDEKHRLYLTSLESSFVNQLHNALLRSSRRPRSSSRLVRTTVLRKNSPQKNVKFERNESADSWLLWLASCREQHCAGSAYPDRNVESRGGIRVNPANSGESDRRSHQHPAARVFHSDLVDGIAEVSDQNFVDEEDDNRSRCIPMAERLKTVVSSSSGNKQVTCKACSVSGC